VIANQYGDESLTSRFVKAAKQRRGFTAWVERVGPIAVGDAVEVVMPPQAVYPGW
jgi:MOSC domain-containing protein YiiM